MTQQRALGERAAPATGEGDDVHWKGMRTIATIRREERVAIPYNKDSQYVDIERKARQFSALHIPTRLQAKLPFKLKPKLDHKRSSSKPTLEQRRARVMEPEERRSYAMMQRINTIRNDKQLKRKQSTKDRHARAQKKQEKEDAPRLAAMKEKRKKQLAKEGALPGRSWHKKAKHA